VKTLTEKEYWDSIHKRKVVEQKQHSMRRHLKVLIASALESKYLRPYADYLLWDVTFKKYLPTTKGANVLEIGSAPGNNLVRFSRTFGFIPYGIEYSDSGVELNREIFSANNINPAHVIHADFLSDQIQEQYAGHFDIVISEGFVEHFDDVEDVIEKHINLLAQGGHLIVSIPNLRGVNYYLQQIFNKELLSLHNTDIMGKREFLKLFDEERLSTLFCDYYGTFNFGLFISKGDSPLRFVLICCKVLQLMLNVIFRLLFRNKGAESKLFSPYLLFIGAKKK
jgi:2-polyprenyl-3-methyl-5-hydroxy-6-metoxy-1,4-benzoquinol methylase